MSEPKFKIGDRVVILGTNVPYMKLGADAVGKITNIAGHFTSHKRSFSEESFDYLVKYNSKYGIYVKVREATAMDEVLCDEL